MGFRFLCLCLVGRFGGGVLWDGLFVFYIGGVLGFSVVFGWMLGGA